MENKIHSIFKLRVREKRQNLPDNRDMLTHSRRIVITRACKYFRHQGEHLLPNYSTAFRHI